MSIPLSVTSSLPSNKVHFWIILSYKSKKSYTIYLKISQHKIANFRRTSGKKKCLFHIKLLQKYFYPPKENEQYILYYPICRDQKTNSFYQFCNEKPYFQTLQQQISMYRTIPSLAPSFHRKGHTRNVYCQLETCPSHAKKE